MFIIGMASGWHVFVGITLLAALFVIAKAQQEE